MGISATTKTMGLAFLAVGLLAGCASSQENMSETCEGTSADVQSAIDEAKAKNADAREMGADWRETRDTIEKAKNAGENCNDDKAMKLAKQAKKNAKTQIDLQKALQEADEQESGSSEPEQMSHSYKVEKGDTLWGISGSSDGYNNPYEWPLIYKANQNKIDDADLIYPGQNFEIQEDPSSGAVDAAIDHAKHRGSWSLGNTEQSDMDYLDNSGSGM